MSNQPISKKQRTELVDVLLAYSGTPRHRLYEYPHRDNDSDRYIANAEAVLDKILSALAQMNQSAAAGNALVLEKLRSLAANTGDFMVHSAAETVTLLNRVKDQPTPAGWEAGAITLDEWRKLDYDGKHSLLDKAKATCDRFDTADFAFQGQRDDGFNHRTAVRIPVGNTDHNWVLADRNGRLQRLHAWSLWVMEFSPAWATDNT